MVPCLCHSKAEHEPSQTLAVQIPGELAVAPPMEDVSEGTN